MEREDHLPRLHVQTLAELNYCVDTARRDAAYACLCDAAMVEWPSEHTERRKMYRRCVVLINAALEATEHSSRGKKDPRSALSEKPLLHLLNLIRQQLETLHSITVHVRNVGDEAEVLAEHLGEDVFRKVEQACFTFLEHELAALKAFRDTLGIGRTLVEANTSGRLEHFTVDEKRRYEKAYNEYMAHYSGEVI